MEVFDALILDYNPLQPRDRYGRWSNGGISKSLTSSGESDKLKTSSKPEWSEKEARDPFRYWKLSSDKTGFPTNWKAKGFSPSTLNDHYNRHGNALGAASKEEYEQKAKEYLQSPRGEHGDAYVRSNGDVCRYDYDSKLFTVGTKDGIIKTFWNLGKDRGEDGADQYWEEQKHG